MRFMFNEIYKNLDKLIEEGYIKVTIKGSPNGKFIEHVGKVIKN